MKPARTYTEARALADAAARRLKQRAEQTVDRQRQSRWAVPVLTRHQAQRVAGR